MRAGLALQVKVLTWQKLVAAPRGFPQQWPRWPPSLVLGGEVSEAEEGPQVVPGQPAGGGEARRKSQIPDWRFPFVIVSVDFKL